MTCSTLHNPTRTLAVAVSLVALTVTPSGAQDRIDPAAAIRVVETDNPVTGELARSVVPDATPAEILRVQVELAKIGHDPGVRSGQLDGPTRRALVNFQTARGLMVCGCLTYETIIALGIRPQVVATVDVASRSPYTVVERHGVTVIDGGAIFLGFPNARFAHRRHRVTGPAVVVGHEPVFGTRPRPPVHRSSVGIRDPRPRPTVQPRVGAPIQSGVRGPRPLPLGARLRPPRP